MRRRNKPGSMDKVLSYKGLAITEYKDYKGQWSKVFGNDHPIHIEIGTGKGKFITEMAEAHPDTNYIGIEYREDILISALKKADAKKLDNLRFVLLDANYIEDCFEDKELSSCYINFCDPWPKKRHYKRRLTYRGLTERYFKLMKEGSWIAFKTDNEDLFKFTLIELVETDMKVRNLTFDLHEESGYKYITTEYEEKFAGMGMPIHRVEFKIR